MQYAENIHQMTCKLLHVVNHYGDVNVMTGNQKVKKRYLDDIDLY